MAYKLKNEGGAPVVLAPAPERPERIPLRGYTVSQDMDGKWILWKPICRPPKVPGAVDIAEFSSEKEALAFAAAMAQPEQAAVPVRSDDATLGALARLQEVREDVIFRLVRDATTMHGHMDVKGLIDYMAGAAHQEAVNWLVSVKERAAKLEQQSDTSGAQWQPIEKGGWPRMCEPFWGLTIHNKVELVAWENAGFWRGRVSFKLKAWQPLSVPTANPEESVGK